MKNIVYSILIFLPHCSQLAMAYYAPSLGPTQLHLRALLAGSEVRHTPSKTLLAPRETLHTASVALFDNGHCPLHGYRPFIIYQTNMRIMKLQRQREPLTMKCAVFWLLELRGAFGQLSHSL